MLFFWYCIVSNNAYAVVKKHAGTGELQLSKKIIDEYFHYITRPLNKLPLVFYISEDKKNFYSVIINNDGGGYAGSGTISKKKKKCELKLKQKCHLFSNIRYIVWDNGINPFDTNVSKINRKISKEDFILKLTKLGFIINEEQQVIKKKKAAKDKKLAKEKAAKEKAAKEKKLAEEKAVKDKKLAKEKAAKEKKLAEEKAAKDKKQEKLDKKLSLIPESTDLKKAQNFLNEVQNFISLYPEEFDIIKVSEFFIKTKPILDGNLDFKLKEDLELFKKYVQSSEKFVEYKDIIEKEKIELNLAEIDNLYLSLEKNIKIIKGFLATKSDSIYLEEWVNNVKNAEIIANDPSSYNQLYIVNEDLVKLIVRNNEIDVTIAEANNTIDILKAHLKVHLITDLAPLLIEQVKLLEEAIKKEKAKDIVFANKTAKEFIYKSIEEPKLKEAEEKKLAEKKAEEEKKLAEEKAEEEKRLAEEKAHEEYLKTPEGQKQEKERKRKEKERLAEEKRLKNFKPVSMTCMYNLQNGMKTYDWVYDGKKLNWNGIELDIPSKSDDGMGTTMSVKKLDGRDKFEVDITAGFVGMVFTNDFSKRSSLLDILGLKVYGKCF